MHVLSGSSEVEGSGIWSEVSSLAVVGLRRSGPSPFSPTDSWMTPGLPGDPSPRTATGTSGPSSGTSVARSLWVGVHPLKNITPKRGLECLLLENVRHHSPIQNRAWSWSSYRGFSLLVATSVILKPHYYCIEPGSVSKTFHFELESCVVYIETCAFESPSFRKLKDW